MILTVTLNASIDKFYLVDALRPYEVARVREVNNTAGGKGMNVSRVAALAGEPVTAMGFVGGHNGALFESLIVEPGITKRFTHTAAETRCCINVRDEAAAAALNSWSRAPRFPRGKWRPFCVISAGSCPRPTWLPSPAACPRPVGGFLRRFGAPGAAGWQTRAAGHQRPTPRRRAGGPPHADQAQRR